MGFINDGAAPRRARRGIIFPVIVINHHYAFRRNGGVVAIVRFIMTGVQQRVIFKLPSICRAQGSINNFAGLKRCPSAGCQGHERDNHNANPGAHPADNRAKCRHCALASHSDVPGHWRQRHTGLPARHEQRKCEVDALTVVMRAEGSGFANGELCHSASEPAR